MVKWQVDLPLPESLMAALWAAIAGVGHLRRGLSQRLAMVVKSAGRGLVSQRPYKGGPVRAPTPSDHFFAGSQTLRQAPDRGGQVPRLVVTAAVGSPVDPPRTPT